MKVTIHCDHTQKSPGSLGLDGLGVGYYLKVVVAVDAVKSGLF
jgi:hypothetical protein